MFPKNNIYAINYPTELFPLSMNQAVRSAIRTFALYLDQYKINQTIFLKYYFLL